MSVEPIIWRPHLALVQNVRLWDCDKIPKVELSTVCREKCGRVPGNQGSGLCGNGDLCGGGGPDEY